MRVARTGLGLVSFLAFSLVTLLWGVAGIIMFIHLVLLPCLAAHALRSRHGRLAPSPPARIITTRHAHPHLGTPPPSPLPRGGGSRSGGRVAVHFDGG